ncbi:MAG: cyclic nucleotide-binding domain-containing protein [Pseudomonadota bacterium]
MESILSPAVLIHLGALLYILGFLVRDELLLRLLVLGGTLLYILYYFFFPASPLWDAIITSLILGAANLWVMGNILLERTTFNMSDDEKKLFEVFSTLNPGQFRKILAVTKWHVANGGETLCTEDERADRLYFIISGNAEVVKGEARFSIPSQKFLGEISFILGGKYSATVLAKPGMKYVEWKTDELQRLMQKKTDLNNAITALFNKDLASKLAVSHQ